MKKTIMITVLTIACIALAVAGTFALITNEQTTVNVVTMGSVKIEALEVKPQTALKVVPAASSDWKVSAKNTGSQEAYLRVKINKQITLAQTGSADPAIMQFDIDNTYWEYHDGFYYYKQPLAAGAESKPLFTKVSFAETAGNLYQQATADAAITIYATQVKNNGSSALNALGWPEEQ